MMRMLMVAGFVVLVVVALGLGATWPWFDVAATDTLRLSEVGGEVLRDHAGAVEEGLPGMVLEPGDRLTTSADGHAIVAHEGGTTMRLGASTTVTVESVQEDALEVELERGQLRARLRGDARAVVIHNQGRTVKASAGELAISADGQGALAAQGSDGALVEGVAGVSDLAAGERLLVGPDGQARTLQPSAEPLLDVRWPGPTRQPIVRVEGTTEPFATVRVVQPPNDVIARANADGWFTLDISLVEGKQDVEVMVVDAFGGSRRALAHLVRDTEGPTVKVQLDYRD